MLASPVLAIGTINVDTSTDRLNSGMHGTFGSGTFTYNVDASTSTHTVSVDMNLDNANVNTYADGKDTTTWHTGVVGETNSFTGAGYFSGNWHSSTNGNYGILGSFVNVNSKPSGADFELTDSQDFNVMSGNHVNNVVGGFYAHASGTTDQVAMNLKSIGSMYVWSEATNPYSNPPLRGNVIEKEVWTTKNTVPNTHLYLGVSTDGIASMSNSNIWGWGIGEKGEPTTNYGGGTRTVTATGAGSCQQDGFGANSLNFNGFSFGGGGSASLSGSFSNGMSGTYNMDAK